MKYEGQHYSTKSAASSLPTAGQSVPELMIIQWEQENKKITFHKLKNVKAGLRKKGAVPNQF